MGGPHKGGFGGGRGGRFIFLDQPQFHARGWDGDHAFRGYVAVKMTMEPDVAWVRILVPLLPSCDPWTSCLIPSAPDSTSAMQRDGLVVGLSAQASMKRLGRSGQCE